MPEMITDATSRNRLLLAHLLRLPELFSENRVNVTNARVFNTDPVLGTVWLLADAYWQDFGKMISAEILKTELLDKVLQGLIRLPAAELQEALSFIYGVPAGELSVEWCRSVLADHFMEHARQMLGSRIQEATTPQDIRDAVMQTETMLSGSSETLPKPCEPFADLFRHLKQAARKPLGVPFVDAMLNGGPAPGEAILYIIPSGCGKTTLGFQIADGCITQARNTDYFSFEQPLAGNLAIRIAVLASGSSMDVWENFAGIVAEQGEEAAMAAMARQIPSDQLHRLERMKPLWEKHFRFIDCTDPKLTFESPLDILRILDKETARTGRKPDVVILDWWGECVDRMSMLDMGKGVSDGDRRVRRRQMMASLIREVSARKLTLIVFHQMKGAAAGRMHARTASSYDSQEDSNLNNKFHLAVASTQKDDQDRVWHVADKARAVGSGKIRLKLDGKYCKFVPVTNLEDL